MRSSETGISIIISDSIDEVKAIATSLGAPDIFRLTTLEQMALIDPEAVFFTIMRTRREAEAFLKFFNVKRGVMSFQGGKREFVGFNIDWMRKLMNNVKPVATMQAPGVFQSTLSHLFSGEVGEKDDPYIDLGYTR